MLRLYKEFFSDPRHSDVNIFEVGNSPFPADVYSQSLYFSSGKRKIGIIDQFQGKRPVLLNRKFIVEEQNINIQIVPGLILDSHIVDMLHRYVVYANDLDQETRKVVRSFLIHVSKINCDYNPVFYLTENWAKSSEKMFLKTSSEKMSSLLKLHCMREDAFIDKNEIIYKKDALEHYYSLYCSNSLDECGYLRAKKFIESERPKIYTNLVNLSYACLLKMVLINFANSKTRPENILNKYSEFIKYLIDEIGLVLGRELNLALYYFSNLTGKFIGVQASMTLSKAIKSLKSTAWDLLLLRLPEFLLTPSSLPELNTAYVVTSEKKLLEIGNLFKMERAFCKTSQSEASATLSFDISPLCNIFGEDGLNELQLHRSELLVKRATQQNISVISDQKLNWLIEDLELQLSYLCQ